MSHSDFKNQVDNLMNILFGGGVANHSTIIEQINYLVFLRALSKKDDSAIKLDSEDERIFAGDLSKYHWDNFLMLNAESLFTTLEEIFRRLPELTQENTIKQLFRDAHVKVFDKPTLRRLVHEIEKMMSELDAEAAHGHTDIFGDMYEYLLGKLAQAGTLGSFRTPRHIIKFIVDVIDPEKGETILDPACGTAGFLVEALKHLEDKYTSDEFKKINKPALDLLNPQERRFLSTNTFTGFDSDFDMFKFGLMNLYLHHLEHPNIKRQNTLVDTAGDRTKWDVILANPPFAGAIDKDSISEDLQMNTRSTEVLFVRYMIDHLSQSGRAGVIVPEGLLFSRSNAHKKVREMLMQTAGLWCVASLPAGIFNPYAGVKTSIIFFDKSLAGKVKEILFVNIENDGFDLGATKRPIDKNDLPITLKIIKNQKNLALQISSPPVRGGVGGSGEQEVVTEKSWLVSLDRIEDNDFILSSSTYKPNSTLSQVYREPKEILREIEDNKLEIDLVEAKIEFCTIGEKLFDTYAHLYNYSHKHESDIMTVEGNKKPDFILDVNGKDVYCELKQFDKDEFSNLIPGEIKSICIDPYARIRKKIEYAREKFRQFKDKPCVLVLYNNKTFTDLDSQVIAGAMFGELTIKFIVPKDPAKDVIELGWFFGEKGKLRFEKNGKENIQNQSISAVIVLEEFNPTEKVFLKAIDHIHISDFSNTEDAYKNIVEIAKTLEKKGEYIPQKKVLRLRVFHNPYANNPIAPLSIFNNEFDEQYEINKSTGAFQIIQRDEK